MAKVKDGFLKQLGSSEGSDSYVLLAGGGHKLLSEFALASDYLAKIGGTVTGNTIFQLGLRVGGMDSNNTNNAGISLRSDQSQLDPLHGLYFGATNTNGTHGAVTGNAAIYFTVDDTTNRGWIFRQNWPGAEANVASISNTGNMTLNGYLKVPGGATPAITSTYYGDKSIYFDSQLRYLGSGGIKEYVITSRLYNVNPSTPTSDYNRVPVILFHGRIQITTSSVFILRYSTSGITLTGTREGTGTATLTMSSSVGGSLPLSSYDYMVVGTGLGCANTTGSPAYLTVPDYYKTATNFRIVISDDSIANEGYVEIMIIKAESPVYYAS